MGQINSPTDLITRLKALEDEVNVIRKQVGLNSATISGGTLTVQKGGAIQMLDPTGAVLFRIGPGLANHGDGTPQQFLEIFDENHQRRLALWDLANPSSRSAQQLYLYDALNHLILATDVNGGFALPWLNVPLYPYFCSPSVGQDTAHGTIYSFANINTGASGLSAGTALWEGRIPFCTHPRISIAGVWGPGSGVTSVSYELDVAGSSVGTWTITSFGASTQGPWDISSHVGQTDLSVQLKITAWSGTGALFCQPLGCYLRQT